ncbi:hypothetical protein NC997_06435 [Trichocoleus sp. DQ-A2]|uniref:hypothetical protein n=1 Tax=Trichocoleus sp. DQ-A2 TaxID=2933924 RepID=UPI0019C90F0D|nr:hypothetical protein [Coleofasciculus sp. FACHB-T130]
MSFLIFFFRNPDPFINPVFYAEDGHDYVGPILTQGFWSTLFTPHINYYVFGNVILAGIAIKISNILYPDNLLYIPQSIALVSYIFYGLVATLPLLLLGDWIRLPYLIALALVSSFFPLHDADAEVLGRVSNVGYSFVYIAFVLIVYRLFCMKRSRFILLVDFIILICAGTNPVVYLLIPVIYIPYLKQLLIEKKSLKFIFKTPAFLSAVILGFLALFKIVYITLNFGMTGTKPTGHFLDSPFILGNAIEMLIARSMLHPIIYSIYEKFNDFVAILVFIVIIIAASLASTKANRWLFVFGFYSLLSFTIIAAVFRPGLSALFNNYTLTGLHRYYYGQNLLAIFLIVLWFHDMALRIKKNLLRQALMVVMLTIFMTGWRDLSTYGNPAYPMREIGNFEQSLIVALKERRFVDIRGIPDSKGRFLEVPIYPRTSTWKMVIPKELAEKSADKGNIMSSMVKCQSKLR